MKTLIVTILLVLCLTSFAAKVTPPTPKTPEEEQPDTGDAEVMTVSTMKGSNQEGSMNYKGECTVEYYYNDYLVRTLKVNHYKKLAWWGNFGYKYDNKVNY